MDNLILASIISTTGLGIFFAAVLAVANRTLKVEEDPKIAALKGILPGINCGACGYAGCQAYAIALVKGDAPVNGCLAGGKDVADKLADFFGVSEKEVIKKIAILHCNATTKERTKSADYKGIETCGAADLIKGVINCTYGCLGYGDCAKVCPFGAVSMIDGLPWINQRRCTACRRCVQVCPRGLFSTEDYNEDMAAVACSSHDKAARVKKICSKGCIACGICQKLSEGVFKIEDNLAAVDYKLARSRQVDWERIISNCPTKVILRI